jgi:hypothetical protein
MLKMQVSYYTAIIAGLLGATLAQTNTTTDFDPFTKPSTGDTVQAGKPYTIEWNLEAANYPGQVQLVLKSGSDPDDLKTLGGIASKPLNCSSSSVSSLKYVSDHHQQTLKTAKANTSGTLVTLFHPATTTTSKSPFSRASRKSQSTIFRRFSQSRVPITALPNTRLELPRVLLI